MTAIGQGECASATPEHIARENHFVKYRQLYFDFAVQVLRWAFPHRQDHRLFTEEGEGKISVFAPDLLENVLMHVTNWCDANDTGFSIAYGSVDERPGQPDYTVMVKGFESTNELLCIALIEACLEAEKELQQDRNNNP